VIKAIMAINGQRVAIYQLLSIVGFQASDA